VIDIGENWVKQTSRNRAEIVTANGVAALTVPVHGYGPKIATRDVRIDDSRRWRHTHWMSIVSACRAAPFFDHYEERFAAVYGRRFEFLVDLNIELLGLVAPVLGLDPGAVAISEEYIVARSGDTDLRGKKSLRRPAAGGSIGDPVCDPSRRPTGDLVQEPAFPEYTQVFHDRMAFVPGLSIIDLLFCEGPSARNFLP
jgi:hypothetical protein